MYKIINKKKLAATVAADFIGYSICGLPHILTRNRAIEPETINSILVIRTAYIGDVVMTLPILKPLRELFPAAKISFLTAASAEPVLRGNPYVNETIAYDPFWFYPQSKDSYRRFMKKMQSCSYDLILEARGDIRDILLIARRIRSRYRVSYDVGGGGYLLTHVVPYHGVNHRVDYHLDMVRFLGYKDDGPEWGIYLAPDENKRILDIMAAKGIHRGFIGVHPGSRLSLKRWAPDRYGSVCDRLGDAFGSQIVLFGAKQEKPIVEEAMAGMKRTVISLAGDLDIREFAGLLSHASLFICNDSAPMHIAAAMKTPTLAIFGPSKSIETGPYGAGHRVVEKNFQCRYSCDENSCGHERYNACMTDITVQDVFQTAEQMITGSDNVKA